MKIAITGGSGRVGRAVAAAALRRGHELVSIDRAPPPDDAPSAGVRYVQADAADYEGMVRAFEGCEALVHLAAIPAPGHHPDHVIHNNNVVGSYNALRAAVETGITRICQASSVNAIGLAFSRAPRFDYFPIDERHPNYCEEPYSLSKWICEQQADSFVRRYEDLRIASMRFHWVVPTRAFAASSFTVESPQAIKNLWAYTLAGDTAEACLLSLDAPFSGHEAFYIAAPDTTVDLPSLELARRFYPAVPVTAPIDGFRTFFDTTKAERMLGWVHKPSARCSST